MSHDPRYSSSPPRPPAPGADPARPRAGYYRARIVEIKRRGPSPRLSTRPEEQQPTMGSAHYGASQALEVDETSSMDSPARPAGNRSRTDGSHGYDEPPPPPPHSPSQRSVSIARGSYMDYESNVPASRSPHFSQPFRQSSPAPPSHQRRENYAATASPSAAIRAARATRSFRHDAEEREIPHQSAPQPPPSHPREGYDPRRLLPTAVRPPQAFQFELEEDPLQLPSSEPHIPGRFPSSPSPMETSERPANSHMSGTLEHIPKMRPKAGSYRELQPYELGLIYSNPAPYQSPAPSTAYAPQDGRDLAEPFIFEIRSPRKGNHSGSNKPAAASKQDAYTARNPAHEADTFPLLRRLGADERYATSFGTERGGSVEYEEAVSRGISDEHDGDGMPMDGVATTGGNDVEDLEVERQRAERRSRR